MVASPAQAAPIDFLTISDAANWEGGNLVFNLTYTGTVDPGVFDFSVVDHSNTPADNTVTASSTDYDTVTSPFYGTAVGYTSSITFPAATASSPSKATVTVKTNTTGAETSDETLKLVATTHGGATTTTGMGTIWNLDANNHIVMSGDTTVPETATNGVQKTVTVTATDTNPQPHDVTIPIKTVDGSGNIWDDKATSAGGANRDYTALPADAVITIPAFQTSGTASVQLWDDAADEQDTQWFNVVQDNPATRPPLGGDVTAGQDTVRIGIQDDDATPTISVGDASSVKEGAPLTFPVTLSNPSEKGATGVTATLTAVGQARGSATAATRGSTGGTTPLYNDVDFIWDNSGSAAAPITIPRYAKSTNVMIPTTKNPQDQTDPSNPVYDFEGPENVNATLSAPLPSGAATLGSPTSANGMITDFGPGEGVDWGTTDAFVNQNFAEGSNGSVDKKIYLRLNSGTLATTLNYSFVDDTAKNGQDYVGTSGSIAVPASGGGADSIVSIPVTIIGDRINEGNEGFILRVTDPNGIADSGDIGDVPFTIVDDDNPPTWTTSDVTVDEGNTGTTMANVPVQLSGPASADATFTANITNGSAAESAAGPGGNDYDMPNVSSLTIKAGDTVGYLQIPIVGDAIYERDESFNVAFSAPGVVNDTSPDTVRSSRVTIRNDDAQPMLTFGQFSGAEGSTVTVNGTIVGASQYQYDLGFTAAGNGDNPATPGTDFTSPTNLGTTTVTIPAGFTGDLSKAPVSFAGLQFQLNNDAVDEATETFAVTASETSAALKGFQNSAATVKIADDPLDLPPTVSIGDVSIGEWEKSVDIPVTLSFAKDNDATSTQQIVTVPYWTVDGAAKAGVNYKETKGTLSIPAGTLTGTINVPVMDDKVKSTAKDFFVKLGKPGPAGATLGKDSSQVLVKDSGGGTTPPPAGGLTIKAPTWVTGSVAVPITGKADAGATVDLWGGAWSPAMPKLMKIASTTADSSGNYKFSRWIGTGYRFQVAVGDKMSDVVKVGINQAPVFVASSPSKGKLSVAVQGNPRGPKQSVVVQAWVGGKWVNTWKGTTGTDNLWKATVSQKSKSSWTLRAFVQGDMTWGINSGYSAAKKVTIK
jgi:hypothetical protein